MCLGKLISWFSLAGEVRTTRRIDYEENQTLNFTVVAFDSGVPQLSSSAEVTVDVINVNDMDPIFNQVKPFSTFVHQTSTTRSYKLNSCSRRLTQPK